LPRVLASLGATAVAVSVLATTPAHAAHKATRAQWNHVARCESGGNWHLNTGNGYYGGLQMSLRTWKSFGGRHYARRPDLTSKSKQIHVADRILAASGWKPWRACAPHAKKRSH
jgi:hypothetical protein